ncbi:MAG: hypothetical protein QME60_02055 [Verrucomicrobiota bacterium]|nr:hypothetical protein [Verrucomicrobiota bacterium]
MPRKGLAARTTVVRRQPSFSRLAGQLRALIQGARGDVRYFL